MVDGVEDCRHIHQKLGEHGPEVLDIPEKHEQRRQDQAHADIEQDQAAGRVQQQDKLPGEGDVIQNAEQEKHAQCQSEVDQSLDVLGQQEQVLRHIDLGEDIRVFQQRGHPQSGRLAEAGKDQVAAEQIGGIVLHRGAEKPGKDQPHHQQRQQRGEQAPRHAQHRSFVLFLEIALYQFLEQELVSFKLLYHSASLRFLPCKFVLCPRKDVFEDVLKPNLAGPVKSERCFRERRSRILQYVLPDRPLPDRIFIQFTEPLSRFPDLLRLCLLCFIEAIHGEVI